MARMPAAGTKGETLNTDPPADAADDKPPAPLVRPKDYGSLLHRIGRGPRPSRGTGYVSPMDCDWPDNSEWGTDAD
jgi:hypothetical protein